MLGGISVILISLVLLKLLIQCFGVDSNSEEEPSNTSYFRLHEAFHSAFSKMMSQGLLVVVVIAGLDIANIQAIHSANLELMIEASLLAVVLWLLLGTVLVFRAQSQMKAWFKQEAVAHNTTELDKIAQTYDKIYRKLEQTGDL